MGRRLAIRFAVGLLSLIGVWFGHNATFVLAAPHGHIRAELLLATGHGVSYLPALVAGAAGLLLALIAGRISLPRLGLIQIGAFVLLEVVERALASGEPLDLFGTPVFWLGVCLQAVVAAAGYFIGRFLAGVMRHLLAPRSLATRAARRFVPYGGRLLPRLSVARAAWNLRGPPAVPPVHN